MAVTHFKRSGQEMMNFPGSGSLDDQYSTAIIFSNRINNPPSKRKKEASDIPIGGASFLQPSTISPHAMINLDQLHTRHLPKVCTGLQLASAEPPSISHNLNQSSPITSSSSPIRIDFATQIKINHYNTELDQLIRAQTHQLRRTLAEKQRKDYKSLLVAAEKSATRIIGEKDAELERAARLASELESRLARLKVESATWQAKAVAENSKAIALHAQLERASAATVAAANGNCCGGGSPVEDAESAYVDADRLTDAAHTAPACRACGTGTVSALVLPCRHVSLCGECSASGVVKACPVCNCVMSGSVQVYLS